MRCKSERPMVKYKKGLWSPDEDKKLTYYVMNYGHSCWSSVPMNAGLQRNGKSCRLRWINYLRPGLKRGAFSLQEEETILTLHGLLGNKWSQISQHLPGRTDNEIKNYWHSHLKKRVAKTEHLQDHYKLEYTNSNMESTSNFTNNSSADMEQLVSQVSQISRLPKLIFADWISLDEFQHDDFNKSSDQPHNGSNYQLSTTEHEWECNKGSTESSEIQNCLNMSGSNDDMFLTHMKLDQVFEMINDEVFNIDDFMNM